MTSDGYVLPSSDDESERLERQAELYGGVRFLDRFIAAQPAEVLEVGCGTGYFARRVGEALPASRVVGVDLDAARIAFAEAHHGGPNVRFVAGDLARLPFADASFDLVFCRFVLVHVGDPTAALREMARVTRQGGRVVAYDMVHDGIWFSPEKPAFARLLRAALDVMRSRGMEPSQGLHLAPSMVRIGLADVAAEVMAHHALGTEPRFEQHRRNWVETVSELAEILAASFEPGLVADALGELESRAAAQFLLEVTVLAHGRKP